MIKTATGVVLASLLAFAPTAEAQGPNLSGTWVLAKDKSDFGLAPGPESRTDVIAHSGAVITVKRSIAQGGPATELTLKYAVDGKAHANATPQGEVLSTLSWDGPVLLINSQLTTPNGETHINDRYSLSNDGKTLTQKRTILVQGQEIKQTIVLVRQ